MSDSFARAETVLASAVSSGGTFTVLYPPGTDAGSFAGTRAHKMFAAGLQAYFNAPADFTVSFGASNITVTYNGTTPLPAGGRVDIQFDMLGKDDRDPYHAGSTKRVNLAPVAVVNLGSPITADTDNMVKAATSTELPGAAGTVTYTPDTDGTSPTDGVGPVVTKNGVKYWEQDVPRNVSVAVSHASSIVAMTVTATGLDEYGNTVVENIAITATGTSKTGSGKKAFKWVRSIAFTVAADATANTANVGFADVLGLPFMLPGTGHVLKEMEDGSAATAGTLVKGDAAKATATTGDVRGTYDPNSAADGSKAFQLVVVASDPTDLGNTQYSG
jgi:hypothetical protein